MPLPTGTRLGPYEILALIGEGGMGQVYKARDMRLDRIVAVKISSQQFNERFEREARAIAALNHPNVCTLFDVGASPSGFAYLVLEYIEGETLAERIAQSAIPLEEALKLAGQIAAALDAAHERGITHRDLKPANIKIRPDGTVKVLDFGLAKLNELPKSSDGSAPRPQDSPTLTIGMSAAGMIMGTASYMSPEQARGKEVDKRADIWAFGVVLYEMLTGKRLFDGEDIGHTLASVIMHEPDLSAVPSPVLPLLKRCLEKDPRHRLRDIGDVMALVGSGAAFQAAAGLQPGSPALSRSRFRAVSAVAAVAVLAAVALAFVHFREIPPNNPSLHVTLPLLDNDQPPTFLALSPDGRWLILSSIAGFWLRDMESGKLTRLAGTESARMPFWSPDSRTIAFFHDGKLKTIPVAGGPAQALCDGTGLGNGGTWGRNGDILYAGSDGRLYRTKPGGGTCMAITKTAGAAPAKSEGTPPNGASGNESQAVAAHTVPVFLPDGQHFLYTIRSTDETRRGIYLASLNDFKGDDPKARRLLADYSGALFVPAARGSANGHILFLREGALMAQPFDTGSLTPRGDPFIVADSVSATSTAPQPAVTASDSGTVVYLANARPDKQLIWFDRTGKELSRVGMPGDIRSMSLSPDGKQVAFTRQNDGFGTLLLRDLERGSETRLATGAAPVWSPDGRRIAFASTPREIRVKDLTSGEEKVVLTARTDKNILAPSAWTRDGRSLLYTDYDPKTDTDVWILPDVDNPVGQRPVALLSTPIEESQAQISPDGKWLAYVTGEPGTNQYAVNLRAFGQGAPGTWRVSTPESRAMQPRWRADGKELFYLDTRAFPRQKLMAAPISLGATPSVGASTTLFEFTGITIVPRNNSFAYSPSPDGQRFLVSANAAEAKPSLEVLVNWREELKK
jgi:serine/threonine protein kinase